MSFNGFLPTLVIDRSACRRVQALICGVLALALIGISRGGLNWGLHLLGAGLLGIGGWWPPGGPTPVPPGLSPGWP